MKPRRPLLAGSVCVALAGVGYVALDDAAAPQPLPPLPNGVATAPAPSPLPAPLAAVDRARRACSVAAMDLCLDELDKQLAATPDAPLLHEARAEALLGRIQAHCVHRGMTPGEPLHSELPAAIATDITAGLQAIARARELGADGGNLDRLEAGLLSHRIVGLASALRWNGAIQAALTRASTKLANDTSHLQGKLQMSLGLRKLLAPSFLGQDLPGALAHFERSAALLPDDERPATFAAMALELQQQRAAALAWLERAAARNPANPYVAGVLARLRADEPEAFARDVPAAAGR